MSTKKRALIASTAVATGCLMSATGVLAQSTSSQQVEEVVVTAAHQAALEGLIVPEQTPKGRSTVTQEYIQTQIPGQTVVQALNLAPGVNFTNNDPYGNSGGNLRIRGFDGNRIALTEDGIPLNDTGNYAIYTNQQLDPELVDRVTVNLGTTDVDTPTAAAAGGVINYVTRKPRSTAGVEASASYGSFNDKRVFAVVDSGAIGPTGLTAFASFSYNNYDKFKGEGDLTKYQYDFRLYQPLKGDDFISIAGHYNVNRNNSYYAPYLPYYVAANGVSTLVTADPQCGSVSIWKCDYYSNYLHDPAIAGHADNDNRGSNVNPGDPTATASGVNYYNNRINPSNTGNLRAQSSFTLFEGVHLTVDPWFQYTLADGGTQTATFSETDPRLRGALGAASAGVDLNHDGDFLDTVRVFSPSVTNTRRYGVNASLVWNLDPRNTLRVAYTLDYGRHRQTGENTFLNADGTPFDPFGGKDGHGPKIFTADGNILRYRDRFSIAKLNQVAAEYRGSWIDDKLKLVLGLRAPYLERDLNQYCYTAVSTGSLGGSTQYCSSQTIASVNPNGSVNLTGTTGTTYIQPFSQAVKYHKLLPNVGVSFQLTDAQMVFASFATELSAPRTDNLYTVTLGNSGSGVNLNSVMPETTQSFDLGYRYQSGAVTGSLDGWYTKFHNRIVSSYDPQTLLSQDHNVGDADLYGVDAELGLRPADHLTVYLSGAYTHTEYKSNLILSATTFAPTQGKAFPEVPAWTLGARIQYQVGPFTAGLQGKYVDKRWVTDVNDLSVSSYETFDLDLRYALDSILKGTDLQLDVTNLFDKHYFGSLGTQVTANTGTAGYTSRPYAYVGAPRTAVVTLHARF